MPCKESANSPLTGLPAMDVDRFIDENRNQLRAAILEVFSERLREGASRDASFELGIVMTDSNWESVHSLQFPFTPVDYEIKE